ncbi:MAG: ATP phosphoribosyltransferase regulatory subunit, partial [Dehalococcoidales bacterium]|nr:ATP phosphoribosyltransferase regulatory subunit [Dehalococcoidales bacterium]
QIDMASGRGFEYYTGVIFQILIGEDSIGGGGRYDALIPLMGGKDIPAFGFALYLDRLMNLAGVENLVKPVAQKVVIEVKPVALKEGFATADYLRKAGYKAEIYLGGQDPTNLRWKLNVQNAAPLFILTDQIEHEIFEAQTATEILTILREKENDNKNSIT